MHKHRTVAFVAIAALTFAACGDTDDTGAEDTTAGATTDGDTTTDGAAAEGSVSFVSPQDGDTVSSPVSWEAQIDGFTVEAAGEVKEGAGHLHILVDQDCFAPGETITKEEGQNHFGDGSTSGELELEPGEHTLCLQLADGEHVALDVTDTITITVE